MNINIPKAVASRRPAARRLSLVLAAGAAAALALTACTAPEADDAVPESPLAAYLSDIYGSDEGGDLQERFADESRRIEDLVAQCMSDAGFEYVPVDYSGSSFAAPDQWNPDDEDWVAEYGYGITDFPGRDDAMSDVADDPNSDYLEGLSESQQGAYTEALYGPPMEVSDDGTEVSVDGSDWEDLGCYGAAAQEVSGVDPMQSEEYAPLMEALNTLWTEASSAPELASIDAKWADCMADDGEPGFAARVEAQQSIQDDVQAYYESQTDFTEEDPAFDKLHEREVELAIKDLQCREKTDYIAKAAKVQFDLETKFIDDHRAELESLKAAVAQGRK